MLSDRTRIGLTVFGGALVIGVVADALLRVGPWGTNLTLFVVAMVAVLFGSARWHRVSMRSTAWLAIPAVLFGAAYAWRDSPVLQNLNLAAAALALALMAMYAGGGLLSTSLVGMAARLAIHFFDLCVGVFPALLRVQWNEIRALNLGAIWAVLRAIAIAIPVVLLFGKLLSTADAVFDALALEVFRFDLADLGVQLVVICWVAYVASGWLHRALAEHGLKAIVPNTKRGLLGRLEITAVLGSLDLLFAAFVVIQARYLFGGADIIAITPNLTYSEYARRGFFELVWVAGLALPLLLALDALRRVDDRANERIFRVLAGIMIVLLLVVMVSGVQRMRLYVEEFGLTELRLYPTAFMAWLAVVFVWFSATALRGQSRRFAIGAISAAFATLLGLNLLNPDAFIARMNIERTATSRPVDVDYLFSLSADAAPLLIDALPTLPGNPRDNARWVLNRWTPPDHPDWRTYNVGWDAAWEAMKRNGDHLVEKAQPAPQPGGNAPGRR